MGRRAAVSRWLAIVVAGASAAAGLTFVGTSPAAGFSATAAEMRCGNTRPEVQLTFDDGGNWSQATSILNTLAAEGVCAGFFPTGDWARRHPDLIDRMRSEGHWLGNHTGSHTDLRRASDAAVRAAIGSGVASGLLRPPGGSFDDRVRRIAESMGYRLCLWTVDPFDWRGISAATVVSRVCSEMQPGGVPVLHLQAQATVEGLAALIGCLRSKSLVLDPLLYHTGAAVDPATRGSLWVTPSGEVRASGLASHGRPPQLSRGREAVGVELAPRGSGYWVVAADGGVFSFGDAGFFGSTGNITLSRPVVGMAPTPSGQGYWLVAADGGVFSFGDAGFFGSTGNLQLAAPVVALARTHSGRGYWMVGADGGVFTFGDAAFLGAGTGDKGRGPALEIAAGAGGGYLIARDDGSIAVWGS